MASNGLPATWSQRLLETDILLPILLMVGALVVGGLLSLWRNRLEAKAASYGDAPSAGAAPAEKP